MLSSFFYAHSPSRVRARYKDFQKFAVIAVTLILYRLILKKIEESKTRFCCHPINRSQKLGYSLDLQPFSSSSLRSPLSQDRKMTANRLNSSCNILIINLHFGCLKFAVTAVTDKPLSFNSIRGGVTVTAKKRNSLGIHYFSVITKNFVCSRPFFQSIFPKNDTTLKTRCLPSRALLFRP